MKNGLTRHPIPVVLFARLVVDRTLLGGEVGPALLKDGVPRAVSAADTIAARAVLVTLLRSQDPWKDSAFVIGGLTPRYLVRARPPDMPPNVGTQDVDIVIDLRMLTDTQAYHTLEKNLYRLGLERATNEKGQIVSWRWQTRTGDGALTVLELLADALEIEGGWVQPLPTAGRIDPGPSSHLPSTGGHGQNR